MDRRGLGGLLAGVVLLASLLVPGAAAAAPAEDPEADVLGWEGGYWHNESIDIDQSDGLDDAELDAYVSRTAARIELIREREFNGSVPVSIISREEYGNRTRGNASDAYRAWNNQVWEALFVVGEDQDVQELLQQTSTDRAVGAYFFSTSEIVIVADGPNQVTIGRRTLAHELVHAQQDQYVDLTNVSSRARVQDEQLATNGLIEGEARYVELQYEARCETEWDCVSAPESSGGNADLNLGVYFTAIFPYSDGPPYVRSLVESDGWGAVAAAFDEPPASTEQVIHRTVEEPAPLSVRDEASAGWSTYPEQGHNGTDTVGEASVFAMLWYQSAEYDADTIPRSTVFGTDGRYDLYDYRSEPSEGWGNDAVLPYRREAAGVVEHGYVWVTEWDTEADAREFREAHRAILDAHDARRVGPRTYVVDDGPFADAFRVVRNGRRVTVVNAPAVEDLADIRPSLPGATAEPTEPADDEPDASPLPPEPTPTTPSTGQPGFGVLAAVAGLLGWWRLRGR